jgi:hypothetical protein
MTPESAGRPAAAPIRPWLLVACVVTSLVVEAAPIACAVAVEASASGGRAPGVALLAIAAFASLASGARQRLAGTIGYRLLSGDWVLVGATAPRPSGRLLLEDLHGRAGPALLDASVVVGYLAVIAVQRPLFAVLAATATCLGHTLTSRMASGERPAPAVDLWSLHVGEDHGDARLRGDGETAEWEASWERRARWLQRLLGRRMWSDVVSETLAYGVAAAGVLPILETPGPRSIAQAILALKLAGGLLRFVGTGAPSRQYVHWVRLVRIALDRYQRRGDRG